jgi:hypothetical protein
MVKLAVGTSAHFIAHGRLQVHVNSTRYVLACTCLREEGVESVVASSCTP